MKKIQKQCQHVLIAGVQRRIGQGLYPQELDTGRSKVDVDGKTDESLASIFTAG